MTTLRSATREDAPTIARIMRGARQQAMPSLPNTHSPADDVMFVRDRMLADCQVCVAEASGRLIGFAAFNQSHLDHLYVSPNDQGDGVGTALLNHVKQQLPRGFDLWVFQQNTRARRFYERHGLVHVESTDGSNNEEREPDARYAWEGKSP